MWASARSWSRPGAFSQAARAEVSRLAVFLSIRKSTLESGWQISHFRPSPESKQLAGFIYWSGGGCDEAFDDPFRIGDGLGPAYGRHPNQRGKVRRRRRNADGGP